MDEREREDLMDELRRARTRQMWAERAEFDGRVCDRAVWERAMDERRERIRALEAELAAAS